MLKVEIIFDESLLREVQMILKQSSIPYYTLVENVKGMGTSGGKFGNSTAPGQNLLLLAVLKEEQAKTLLHAIRRFKELNPKLGVHTIVSDVKEWI